MKRSFPILLVLVLGLSACGPAVDLTSWQPELVIDSGIDPNTWATVPAGEFPSGQNDHIVNIDYDYHIMVTDVTNQQYADFLNEYEIQFISSILYIFSSHSNG